MDIRKQISKIESIAQSGNTKGAINLSNHLIEENRSDYRVWNLRAYLHARNGEYEKAISDLDEAINLNPNEPKLFFDRGRHNLATKNEAAAIADCTTGIALCDEKRNSYYKEALHFVRADAYLRLRKRQETLDDLSQISDDCSLFTDRLRRKEDLLDEVDKL